MKTSYLPLKSILISSIDLAFWRMFIYNFVYIIFKIIKSIYKIIKSSVCSLKSEKFELLYSYPLLLNKIFEIL